MLAIVQRFVHWSGIASLSCHIHDGVVYACAESGIPPCDAPYCAELVEELINHAYLMARVVSRDLVRFYKDERFMRVI